MGCYFGCFSFLHAGLFCRERRISNGFLNFDSFTAGALPTLILCDVMFDTSFVTMLAFMTGSVVLSARHFE